MVFLKIELLELDAYYLNYKKNYEENYYKPDIYFKKILMIN